MQFKVVPFELINARVTFNCMMRKLFNEAADIEVFVDDVLIHMKGWEEHIETAKSSKHSDMLHSPLARRKLR